MSSPATTMRALQFDPVTMPSALEKSLHLNATATRPTPGTDQLLIKVVSAAVNPVDHKLAELPLINRLVFRGVSSPGLDFAGEVAALGPSSSNAQDLQPGQRVFGRLNSPSSMGSLAEYTLANLNGCVALPEGVSFDEAAGIATVGETAYQCIVPHVRADSGEAVFIHGGSGGCGVFGIQIAKALGCHVTTTCSTRNVDFCKSLGADEVIDYSEQNVATALRKLGAHHQYTLIVDNVGSSADIYPICHEFTRPQAKYVQVGASISPKGIFELLKAMILPAFLGGGRRSFQFVGVQNNAEDLKQLGQWVKEGKVKAPVGKVYSLEDGAKAYEDLKARRGQGKIIVRVSE